MPRRALVVLAALAEAEPVLEELRAASRRPTPGSTCATTQTIRRRFSCRTTRSSNAPVQVLQLRASAELALGDTDPAAEDIQFMFRLTDAIRNEPLLIGQLVRLAELNIALQPLAEGLARHQWSEPQLRAFEERLRQFDFLADGRQGLAGRAGFLWRRCH